MTLKVIEEAKAGQVGHIPSFLQPERENAMPPQTDGDVCSVNSLSLSLS